MKGVFTAEPAILFQFKTVRIVFLVFCRVVISLLAFTANECYFHSHSVHLPVNLRFYLPRRRIFLLSHFFESKSNLSKNVHNKKNSSNRGKSSIAHIFGFVKGFCRFFRNLRRYSSQKRVLSNNIYINNKEISCLLLQYPGGYAIIFCKIGCRSCFSAHAAQKGCGGMKPEFNKKYNNKNKKHMYKQTDLNLPTPQNKIKKQKANKPNTRHTLNLNVQNK